MWATTTTEGFFPPEIVLAPPSNDAPDHHRWEDIAYWLTAYGQVLKRQVSARSAVRPKLSTSFFCRPRPQVSKSSWSSDKLPGTTVTGTRMAPDILPAN